MGACTTDHRTAVWHRFSARIGLCSRPDQRGEPGVITPPPSGIPEAGEGFEEVRPEMCDLGRGVEPAIDLGHARHGRPLGAGLVKGHKVGNRPEVVGNPDGSRADSRPPGAGGP